LTGFGAAIVFHVFWELLLLIIGCQGYPDLLRSVLVIRFMTLITTYPLVYAAWREAHPYLTLRLLPCVSFGTIFGTLLLVSSEPKELKLVLSVVFIAFALWRIASDVAQSSFSKRFLPERCHARASAGPNSLPPLDVCEWPPLAEGEAPRPLSEKLRILWRMCLQTPQGWDTPRRRHLLNLLTIGLGSAAGFLGGLLGVAGPPLMVTAALPTVPCVRLMPG
jgi:uncharacterized membrane protein YfcA